MKDTKSLYLAAKASRNENDINEYLEHVKYLLENEPATYMSDIEYIISSNIGLTTLNEFMNKYNGIPIYMYDIIMESLERNEKRYRIYNPNDSIYSETIEIVNDFKKKYNHCFMMYESYKDITNEYLKNYSYKRDTKSFNDSFSRYGPICIPDNLIQYNENYLIILPILETVNDSIQANPKLRQWLLEAMKDFNIGNVDILNKIYNESLEGIVESVRDRNKQLFREAMILDNEDTMIEYSKSELNVIEDLISFNEYKLTCLENENEIMELQKEIYSLYEEFDGLLEEDIADSVIPNLPGNKLEYANTSNKKSGSSPDYIKNNHNMARYGEEDNENKKDNSKEGNDEEISLDDFKRPSADPSYNTDTTSTSNEEEPKEELTPAEKQQAINNYYYYTYTNSFNKKKHSDSSIRNIKNVDNSRKANDDHSVNKRIHIDDNYSKNESAPWEIDITSVLNPIMENTDEYQSYWNRERIVFDRLAKSTLDEYYKLIRKWIPEVIKNDGSLEALNKKEIIDEILKKGQIYNGHLWGPHICLFNGAQGYETTDKNDLIAKCYGICIRKLINEKKESFSEIFDSALILNNPKVLGWSDKIDDIPGIDLEVKDLDKNVTIKIDGCSFNFYVDVIGNIKKSNFGTKQSYYPAAKFLYNFNKKAFETDQIGMKDLIIHFIREKQYITTISDKNNKNLSQCLEANTLYLLPAGKIVLTFKIKKSDKKISVKINDKLKVIIEDYNEELLKEATQLYQEDVGDADDHKPKSDSPVRDALQDVDRTIASSGQTVKKGVQTVVQTGKAFTKPVKRASQWITNMITQWKDKNENEIKEKMADPHSRNNLFKGIKTAIIGGSLFKAGILLNPVFLFLAITKKAGDSKKSFRLRNEIIGELKVELEVIEEKIKDADHKGDNKAKYQLMRFKNEINKKLIRVGGTKEMAKMI